jgi:hypothetical protein
MRIARTLEAAWRQGLCGSVSQGAKEDESRTGRVWAAGFHHVRARSRLARVLKLKHRLFNLFSIFFSGRGKPRILNHRVLEHDCATMHGLQHITISVIKLFCSNSFRSGVY